MKTIFNVHFRIETIFCIGFVNEIISFISKATKPYKQFPLDIIADIDLDELEVITEKYNFEFIIDNNTLILSGH